jgi:hypothetical protein
MTPGVYAYLVAVCDGALGFERPVHDVGADVEHGGFLGLGGEVVVEGIVRAVWTVVETESESLGLQRGQRRGEGEGVGSEIPRER